MLDSNNSMAVQEPARWFYRTCMNVLNEHQVPFLVGGAHALYRYTDVTRDTKDFDIFVQYKDCRVALELFSQAGFRTEMTDERWLGKAFYEKYFVDLIFSGANCIAVVDDLWFEHSRPAEVLGTPCRLIPVEEMIWSKAFVTDRDRFDGADIMHLILRCRETLDWQRLLIRFGEQWSVLLIYLIYFDFVYPSERSAIPDWLRRELFARGQAQLDSPVSQQKVCNGTIFSRTQYLIDIRQWGFNDGMQPFVRKRFASDNEAA